MKHSMMLIEVTLLLAALLFSCKGRPPLPVETISVSPVASLATYISITPDPGPISGIVLDAEGAPLSGAAVRIQATNNQTISDNEGRFTLSNMKENSPVTVSAWKEGYYCAKVEQVVPPEDDIIIHMRLLQTTDNPDYEWIPPIGENSCYSCKPEVTQVWLDNDAHGKSATNIRFITMYTGTDVNGNQSPLTKYGFSRDYGRIPLLPDQTKPYYGPGYKLDFPDTAGNCSACHLPGAALDSPYGTDPTRANGVNSYGIHCDYCHKVSDVKLDSVTGLPYPNMPGVLSQEILRPFPEDPDRYQLFFGSFDDDNVPMEDTYLPLIKESQWCAPCHFGVFWNTVIYNSYGEWLASPYSNPITGKTCQQCHMPVPTLLNGQQLTNVATGKGGVERDPVTIPAHTFPGAFNLELLQNSVTMSVSAYRTSEKTTVNVLITNDQTGHSIPTDSPLRQMILLVQVVDMEGSLLPQVNGPTVPDWGGVGNPSQGYYAGLPGSGYAKILRELWTEVAPTGAYWNPTQIASDNRITAMSSDSTTYEFSSPLTGMVRIDVRLIFRRAFIDLAREKGWDIKDILMEAETIEVKQP